MALGGRHLGWGWGRILNGAMINRLKTQHYFQGRTTSIIPDPSCYNFQILFLKKYELIFWKNPCLPASWKVVGKCISDKILGEGPIRNHHTYPCTHQYPQHFCSTEKILLHKQLSWKSCVNISKNQWKIYYQQAHSLVWISVPWEIIGYFHFIASRN